MSASAILEIALALFISILMELVLVRYPALLLRKMVTEGVRFRFPVMYTELNETSDTERLEKVIIRVTSLTERFPFSELKEIE
jgi:hypothetical protein